MRPVRWSFHAQRTATKLAREVRGRMLGAWKRQTVAWLRPDDAGGVPIRTLSVTLDAVLVGGIATCSGVVTGWSPATVATFRTSGATVASGTITLDETGGYSFPLTVAPGVTTIIVEAVDRGLVARAADQVERILPALVVHVAASLDGTTMHVTGWLDGWIDETTAAYVVAGGATGSGPVTLAPDRTFSFDVTGLGYGITTVTITATDSWRSDDGADSVNRVAPTLSITAFAELVTTTGIKAHLSGTVANAIGGITRLWYSYRDQDGPSVDYDITTATPFDVENGTWADGHNEYTFHVTDGLGRTAHATVVYIDVAPLALAFLRKHFANGTPTITWSYSGNYGSASVSASRFKIGDGAWSSANPGTPSGGVVSTDIPLSNLLPSGVAISIDLTLDGGDGRQVNACEIVVIPGTVTVEEGYPTNPYTDVDGYNVLYPTSTTATWNPSAHCWQGVTVVSGLFSGGAPGETDFSTIVTAYAGYFSVSVSDDIGLRSGTGNTANVPTGTWMPTGSATMDTGIRVSSLSISSYG